MNDPDDPVITEKDVPFYNEIERKIREIDNTIVIYRIYYLFNSFTYRFQLIKKDMMCMIDIPKSLLDNLHKDGTSAERKLDNILVLNVESTECWSQFKS